MSQSLLQLVRDNPTRERWAVFADHVASQPGGEILASYLLLALERGHSSESAQMRELRSALIEEFQPFLRVPPGSLKWNAHLLSEATVPLSMMRTVLEHPLAAQLDTLKVLQIAGDLFTGMRGTFPSLRKLKLSSANGDTPPTSWSRVNLQGLSLLFPRLTELDVGGGLFESFAFQLPLLRRLSLLGALAPHHFETLAHATIPAIEELTIYSGGVDLGGGWGPVPAFPEWLGTCHNLRSFRLENYWLGSSLGAIATLPRRAIVTLAFAVLPPVDAQSPEPLPRRAALDSLLAVADRVRLMENLFITDYFTGEEIEEISKCFPRATVQQYGDDDYDYEDEDDDGTGTDDDEDAS